MRIYLFVALLIGSFSLQAQIEQGQIIYKQTIKVDFSKAEGASEMPPAILAMLPNSFDNHYILRFTNEAMLYEKYDNPDLTTNEAYQSDNKIDIQMIGMGGEDASYYANFETGKIVEKRSILGKPFRIEEEKPEKAKWKLTGKQKSILGYPCQQALTEGEEAMEVWFTTAIPVSVGPAPFGYSGLPGAILEISSSSEKNSIQWVADKIELGAVDVDKVVPPKKGKKISREAFERLEKEKMEEQEALRKAESGGSSFSLEIDND